MEALAVWKESLSRYRAGRGEDDITFWERNAGWYARSPQIASRTAIWMPLLQPWAEGARVLEIGPGPGVFTLPLAAVAKQVVAVEPSPAMGSALCARLTPDLTPRIELVRQTIEEFLADDQRSFDLVVASHSLYNIEAIDAVVQELVQRAPRVAILMSLDYTYHWRTPIELHFRRGPRCPAPSAREFVPVLWEMGIYPDIRLRKSQHGDVFPNEQALLDWVLPYLRLSESDRDEVAELLRPSYRFPAEGGITLHEESRELLIISERDLHVAGKE